MDSPFEKVFAGPRADGVEALVDFVFGVFQGTGLIFTSLREGLDAVVGRAQTTGVLGASAGAAKLALGFCDIETRLFDRRKTTEQKSGQNGDKTKHLQPFKVAVHYDIAADYAPRGRVKTCRVENLPRRSIIAANGGVMEKMQIHSILLATDFSERSAKAEAYAVEMAIQSRAALHVVTAIEPIMGVEAGDEDAAEFKEFYDKLIRRAETELEARLGRWTSEHQMVVRHHIHLGHRWQVVVEASETHDVDLVVLGKRPLSADMAFGTTSQKVFLACKRPVLFVPAS